MSLRFFVLLSLMFSLLNPAAHANTSLEELVPAVPDWIGETPATPESDEIWDWVQLDTNEWIKGEILFLYDDAMEFDSDNFGVLSLDWGDVIEVRSGREYRIGVDQGEADLIGSLIDAENGDLIVGTLYINQENAYVTGSDGQQWTLARDEVLTITAGNPTEGNLWSVTASIGITTNTGNTESEAFNLFVNANRRTVNNRLIIDYKGIFETTNNEKTANNNRLRGTYDIFQTRNFFYRPVYLEYYTDEFQNLDYRVTYSPGIGFYLIDRSGLDWDVTFGPVLQENRFNSVEAGNDRTQSSAGLLVVTTSNIDITPDIEWYLEYTLQTGKDEVGGNSHRFFTSLDVELTGQLDFVISYNIDYLEDPVADEDGFTPDKTDTRLMFSLAYEY